MLFTAVMYLELPIQRIKRKRTKTIPSPASQKVHPPHQPSPPSTHTVYISSFVSTDDSYSNISTLFFSIPLIMSAPMAFSFLFLLFASFPFHSSSASTPSLSAYQILLSYDFPVGLLPKGVTNYELDPSTGKFSVKLNKTCTFTIDGYELKYKTTITGTIAKDKITNLSGIQVKILFFWINIAEVSRDGDELDFSVGIASASFPIDNFYESPQCGCGFDCVNYSGRVISLKRRMVPLLQAADMID